MYCMEICECCGLSFGYLSCLNVVHRCMQCFFTGTNRVSINLNPLGQFPKKFSNSHSIIDSYRPAPFDILLALISYKDFMFFSPSEMDAAAEGEESIINPNMTDLEFFG